MTPEENAGLNHIAVRIYPGDDGLVKFDILSEDGSVIYKRLHYTPEAARAIAQKLTLASYYLEDYGK